MRGHTRTSAFSLILLTTAAASFGLAGCAQKPVLPPLEGRWESVAVTGVAERRTVLLRLEKDGKFFGNEKREGSTIEYVMSGTWEKTAEHAITLRPDGSKETYTAVLGPDATLTLTAGDVVAAMRKAN